ncbi:MAG: protein kinase [Bryobacteraceae bacterium]
MTPERWAQVKDLFDAALASAPEDRAPLLARRCAGDEELREEVESLLAAHDEEFLEQPVSADEEFAEPLAPSVTPGTRVGAYEIVKELGRGGMGAVYLATRADREFRKRVAIKLIRHDMQSAFTIRRFRSERQILATLEHPNIARLIDGGTTVEGLPYLVMEYVEGEPLHQYCEAHALSVKQRLQLFLKVCSAVHYAHRRMIVHRDLKPGNVLVQQDGTPKLLDFGIAKLLDPGSDERSAEITVAGMRAMTPAYASPEQKRGETATVRSDIYSLGVILEEIITGRRVRDENGDNTTSVGTPPTAPTDLSMIVGKATRTEPDERYENVEKLVEDVERFLAGTAVPLYEFASTRDKTGTLEPAAPGSVAILPLRLLNPDTSSDAYLGTGIADAVITKLSNVARIEVRPTSAVMRYADTADPAQAGRELGVDFVLEGRIHKSGTHVRVTVQLVRVRTGSPIWAAHFDEEFHDLLKLEDSISGQVALALIPQLSGEEQERLARRGTANPRAHEAYLRGRWHWSARTEDARAKALVSFMEAIAEDPQYAMAHAGVADYYIQLALWGGLPPAESFGAAKEAAQRALDIDDSLAEAHASFAFALWALDRDYAGASHHFQMAIALNPDLTQAHHWFGLFNLMRNRPEIALVSLESAQRQNPQSVITTISLAFCLYNAEQYDRAIETLQGGIRRCGDDGTIQELLAWCYLGKEQLTQALNAARRAVDLSERGPFALAALARVEAAIGNQIATQEVIDELNRMAASRYISHCALGNAYIGVGRMSEALDHLEQAWNDHDWWALFANVSPAWEPLRRTPEYQRRLTEYGLSGRKAKQPAAAPEVPKQRAKFITGVVVAAVLMAAYLVVTQLRTPSPPFETTRMARLTTNGTAARAVISPDGKRVAYVSSQNGKAVLWLRSVDSAETQLLAGPMEGDINSLNFTSNGTHICFINASKTEPARGVFYQVPVGGGAPQRLMADISGPISPSVNGTRVAFLRADPSGQTDCLYVANLDGSGERKIATRHYPERFTWTSLPAWSADGSRLAVAVEGSDTKGFYVHLMTIRIADGSTRIIEQPRWQYIERISWLDRTGGLVVIGQEADSSFQHIWYVPHPKGAIKRINNDLSDYIGVSVTADGRALVSVQYQTMANVYVLRREGSREVQVTPGMGRYFDLSWTPDGRIVYASDASGSADIWIMNGDGTGQHQITANSARNYAPAVSPDGNWVVFHSNRSGNWNIWRMGINGVDPRALTFERRDSNWPHFTPDGRDVVYHHTGNGGWAIWKVPLAGGTPIQLTGAIATHPAVSPKDGRIACWYSENMAEPSWKLAVFPAEGGHPLRTFNLPTSAVPDTALAWTPDGAGITYMDGRGGASNLWVQPADAGASRPLTQFTSGQIYSFDWSPDGRLAYSRGVSSSDVVMIRDTQQP